MTTLVIREGPDTIKVDSVTRLNVQETRIRAASTLLDLSVSGTATSLIPAGAVVFGMTTRVVTTVTGPTSYDVGDGSDQDAWGAGIAVSAGTISDNTDWTATAVTMYPAANDVVLTPVGGAFTGGQVRVTVHYLDVVAPTS